MQTKEVIDRIFKEPGLQYELKEFENLGKPFHEILNIYPKVVETGRDSGKTKYVLKSLVPFASGAEEVQVYVESGKSVPEELVGQLWVYRLIHQYVYLPDGIELEKSIQFSTEVGTKNADIIVYSASTKVTPKSIIECKRPKCKDSIEQLKSYVNAKGAPVAVWSNGSDSINLYRFSESKKMKNQFFMSRHVVEMCERRMLNPKCDEYVMDPDCGSGGFLLHAMDWCYPSKNNEAREPRKFKFASKYLWP